MENSPSEVRHSIRGTFNALKLCVSALEMPMEDPERLEFLSDIESSADNLALLLDQYDAFPIDAHSASTASATTAATTAVVTERGPGGGAAVTAGP